MCKLWKGGLLLAGCLTLGATVRAQPGPDGPGPAAAGPYGQGPAPVIGCMEPPPGYSLALCDPPPLRPNAFNGESLPDPYPGARVSGGVLILQPQFGNNPAYTISSPSQFREQEFGYNPQPGYWFEVGAINEDGYGIRVHGWHWEDDAVVVARNSDLTGLTTVTSAAPLPGFILVSPTPRTPLAPEGDNLTFSSGLKFDVADLEVGRAVQGGALSYLVTVGARYARVSQHYIAIREDDLDTSSLTYGHTFKGGGPTVLGEVWRQIGDSGISLFGNLRVSALYGRKNEDAYLLRSIQGVTRFSQATTGSNDVLPIVESEIGAQWGTAWGQIFPFFQASFVSQGWFGVGDASSQNGTLTMLGARFTAGVRF